MPLTSQRRLVCWIAVCAILFGALAPTLTHTLARLAHRNDAETLVCTATGLITVADAAPDRHDPGKGARTEHCPYCNIHAASFGLPPPTGLAFVVLGGRDPVLPERFYRAPAPLFAWAAAQPRAPPARL